MYALLSRRALKPFNDITFFVHTSIVKCFLKAAHTKTSENAYIYVLPTSKTQDFNMCHFVTL